MYFTPVLVYFLQHTPIDAHSGTSEKKRKPNNKKKKGKRKKERRHPPPQVYERPQLAIDREWAGKRSHNVSDSTGHAAHKSIALRQEKANPSSTSDPSATPAWPWATRNSFRGKANNGCHLLTRLCNECQTLPSVRGPSGDQSIAHRCLSSLPTMYERYPYVVPHTQAASSRRAFHPPSR
jgi:hypothetical protein